MKELASSLMVAYKDGSVDRNLGFPISENPYTTTIYAVAWAIGWLLG